MRALIVMLLMTTAANAEEAASVDAARCWNPPPLVSLDGFRAVFDVDLGQDGRPVAIKVTEFSPDTAEGRDIVRSASLAIERCAPYPASGRVAVTLDEGAFLTEPLDPFAD